MSWKCNSLLSLCTLLSLDMVICSIPVRLVPVLSPSVFTYTSSLNMDFVAFAYRWSFRNAGYPVPPISSFFDLPTVLQVHEAGASGSQNLQGGDGGDENSRNKTRKAQSEGELPHDQVQDEYSNSEEDKANLDDGEDRHDDNLAVSGDDYIVEG